MTRTAKKENTNSCNGKGRKSTKMTKQRNHQRSRTSIRSAIERYHQGNSVGLEYEATYAPSRNHAYSIDPCVCCCFSGGLVCGRKGKGPWGG